MAASPAVYVLRDGKRVRVRLGGPIPPANVEVAGVDDALRLTL